ncbi:hypothetical protein ICN28_03915 [Polynucleobacter sp. 30F-ANTBAC]|uniref:hypothetical protein n=1 Tax=Polynucleobacter sp. 30F-ANTBAC TaxID=2689095 RepID=UPI001C0B4F2A|nr:hypothetical protein [Polynucleobacter sp. 30F-ANTBAC]MBU3599659.1 hypothetical protein [Polynucleobacter sp. 30F-ANTBAC]
MILTGRFITAIVGILSIRLSTSFLIPYEYGILAVLISIQSFCGLFLINPVGQYINRHTHEWIDHKTLFSKLQRYLTYLIFVGFISGLIVYIWLKNESEIISPYLGYELAIFTMVLFGTLNATYIAILNMMGYRFESVLWLSLTSILGLLFSSVLIQFHPEGLYWFWGQAVAMLVGYMGAKYQLEKKLQFFSTGSLNLLEKDVLKNYICPLAISTFFIWWLTSGYRIYFESQWGLESLGYLVVGMGVSSAIWAIIEILGIQFLNPYFYRRISLGKIGLGYKAYSDLVNTLGPIYLVLCASNIYVASLLLKLLVTDVYSNASIFVIFGAIIECSRAITNLYGNGAQIEKKISSVIMPYLIASLLFAVGLFLIYTLNLNLNFALISLLCSSIVMFLLMTFKAIYLYRLRLDWKRWGLGFFMIGLSILMSVFMPFNANNTFDAFLDILIFGTFTLIFVSIMTLTSKSLRRLVSVKLRDEK